MGTWACTHENNSGTRKTVIHWGNQCTDEWNQDNSCAYFKATWKFISCEQRVFALEDDKLVIVDPDTIEPQQDREQRSK